MVSRPHISPLGHPEDLTIFLWSPWRKEALTCSALHRSVPGNRSTQETDVQGTRCLKSLPLKIVGHGEHSGFGIPSLLNEHFLYLLSKYQVVYLFLPVTFLQSWSHIGSCPYFSMIISFIFLQDFSWLWSSHPSPCKPRIIDMDLAKFPPDPSQDIKVFSCPAPV